MSFFAFQDIIMAVTGIMILITLVLSLLVAAGEKDAEAEANLATVDDLTRRDELASKLTILNEQLVGSQNQLAKLANFDTEEIGRDIAVKENKSADLNRQNAVTLNKIASRKAVLENLKESKDDSVEQRVARLKAELEKKQRQTKAESNEDRIVFVNRSDSKKTPWLVSLDSKGIKATRAGVTEAPELFRSTKKFFDFASKKSKTSYFVFLLKPSGLTKFDDIYLRAYKFNLRKSRDSKFQHGLVIIGENENVIDDEKGAGF